MSNITVTYRDGRVAQLEQVYIRGSKIRFLILPDMLKNAPMLKSMKNKNQGSGAGRGKAAILKAQGEGGGVLDQNLTGQTSHRCFQPLFWTAGLQSSASTQTSNHMFVFLWNFLWIYVLTHVVASPKKSHKRRGHALSAVLHTDVNSCSADHTPLDQGCLIGSDPVVLTFCPSVCLQWRRGVGVVVEWDEETSSRRGDNCCRHVGSCIGFVFVFFLLFGLDV